MGEFSRRVSEPPRETLGTVVGRVAADVLCVLAESGWTVTVRVPVELAHQLPVGKRARLILGPDGWPTSLALAAS